MRAHWSWLLIGALPLAGCASNGPWVEIKGRRFEVEVVADDESRARGLMFRDSLPEDRGMLFVFEREQELSFWMKNTRIPLDILYFDASRKLVSIAAGVPPCTTPQCPAYPSDGPARYALELNAGLAEKLAIRPGDEMNVDPATLAAHGIEPR